MEEKTDRGYKIPGTLSIPEKPLITTGLPTRQFVLYSMGMGGNLTINGSPPPEHLKGPKDTVLLWPGDRIKILIRFDDYLGKYMYHCHFLEHEDQGMMGVLEVFNRNDS